ncbi:MAG: sigma-70 family RNA polymerase sigma factor [Planctomycetes bacterium]|nr:sigma-70 family RNA polymerase sigma factor [Planctomycetota bacterium]
MVALLPEDVIRRAREGEPAARHEIVAAYARPIRATVRKLLGTRNAGDVDDCVQEVFLRIFAHLGDFDPERGVRFSTWAYALARNFCFDQFKRRRLPCVPLSVSDADGEPAGEWLGETEPPESRAERREFLGALGRALNDLPAELRGIFRLREFEGWEFRAIARRLRLPLGTVKSKHYRALDRLRALLRSFRLAS